MAEIATTIQHMQTWSEDDFVEFLDRDFELFWKIAQVASRNKTQAIYEKMKEDQLARFSFIAEPLTTLERRPAYSALELTPVPKPMPVPNPAPSTHPEPTSFPLPEPEVLSSSPPESESASTPTLLQRNTSSRIDEPLALAPYPLPESTSTSKDTSERLNTEVPEGDDRSTIQQDPKRTLLYSEQSRTKYFSAKFENYINEPWKFWKQSQEQSQEQSEELSLEERLKSILESAIQYETTRDEGIVRCRFVYVMCYALYYQQTGSEHIIKSKVKEFLSKNGISIESESEWSSRLKIGQQEVSFCVKLQPLRLDFSILFIPEIEDQIWQNCDWNSRRKFHKYITKLKDQKIIDWSESSKARLAADAVLCNLAGEETEILIQMKGIIAKKRSAPAYNGEDNSPKYFTRTNKRICTRSVQQMQNEPSHPIDATGSVQQMQIEPSYLINATESNCNEHFSYPQTGVFEQGNYNPIVNPETSDHDGADHTAYLLDLLSDEQFNLLNQGVLQNQYNPAL